MYRVVCKRALNEAVTWMEVEAPLIAQKARAGQFVILRVNETGERIPLTIAAHDAERGTVTIVFQKVGKTTLLLDTLQVGDSLLDFVGPLGRATEIEGHKKVAIIGGGVGTAIAYPEAKA
ncbi:MAG: sulfide/dihydroorotate dehydrogenase-like FAD/NAD-binding protein, partial [Clostridia bacterium]|nr:sulfide/dihydroorotate dehydrogenase-like FAD/NAD-binding protein [Clostridia bacterium]